MENWLVPLQYIVWCSSMEADIRHIQCFETAKWQTGHPDCKQTATVIVTIACIAAKHRLFTHVRQVAPICTPKWHLDQFGRFCRAHGHDDNKHTTVLLLFWNMSGTTRVSRYQKGKTRKVKTNLDLLEQEIGSGSGICWAICKICTLTQTQPHKHPTTQFFTGRMPFLLPNQQRQSTEGTSTEGT